MFEFTGKLKTITFVLMLIGAVSIGASFMGGGDDHHGDADHTEHQDANHDAATTHDNESGTGATHSNESNPVATHNYESNHESHNAGATHSNESNPVATHNNESSHESHATEHGDDKLIHKQSGRVEHEHCEDDFHKSSSRATRDNNHFYTSPEHHDAEHAHHQEMNKPWANLMVNNFFFLALALGALFFLAIQYAAQAGWSIVVTRIMEAMAQYIAIPVLIMLVLIVLGVNHSHHLWHWMAEGIMDPASANFDALLKGKEGYLNGPFFIARTVIYLVGWAGFAFLIRKMSIKLEVDPNAGARWKKMRNYSAGFLVFFAITSSMSAWDWIMSIDPHWFSTLFGWYIFAGIFVSALTAMTLILIYLKSKGYMPEVNDSHLQDLAKFMFAFSIFWTYLWFSQFMLIWYSNIPEEVTYFVTRFQDYKLPFLGMVVMNFVFPILMLMNADYKRIPWFVVMAGLVILFGHYIDIFNMIMPATVGDRWFIGIPEISSVLLFAGLFIFVVFTALTKAPLLVKRYPFRKESEEFHY